MSQDQQISFADVGNVDDEPPASTSSMHPSASGARLAPPAGRVPTGAPGRGAIPNGAPPPTPFAPTSPAAAASVPLPHTVPAPQIQAPRAFPATPPQPPAAPSPPPPPRADEADEKRIQRLCDAVCERLHDRGESTAKSILEQFAAQGGSRFVERLSQSIAAQAVAALQPVRMRRLVVSCALLLLVLGVAIGTAIGVTVQGSLLRDGGLRNAQPADMALRAFVKRNNASLVRRIAACDPSLGLIQRNGRDGRVRCAGAAGARFGWLTVDASP